MFRISPISNTRAQVDGPFDEELLDGIDELLRWRSNGYRFSPAYRRKQWDGYNRIFSKETQTFAIGAMPLVSNYLKKQGHKARVIDGRTPPALPVRDPKEARLIDDEGGRLRLYPYQRKCVRLALDKTRGIIHAATGSGKTEVMAGIIECLTDEEPPKTLIIVPSRKLLRDTAARFEKRLGVKVGMIGDGKWEEEQVTVAIPDTIVSKKWEKHRQKLMRSVDVLLLDEAHHAPSSKWHSVVSRCNAFYRFALSATPLDRGDKANLKLVGAIGPVIARVTSEQLREIDTLAHTKVVIEPVKAPELPHTLSYDEAYNLGIVKNKSFHKRVIKRIKKEADRGRNVLVLIERIEHGRHLSRMLGDIPHQFVHGKIAPDEADAMVETFAKREIPIMIGSRVFGEGVDVPSIDSLINAAAGASVIATTQKAGRAMRKKKGRPNRCWVYDYHHKTHPFLEKHSEERLRVYEAEKFDILVKSS